MKTTLHSIAFKVHTHPKFFQSLTVIGKAVKFTYEIFRQPVLTGTSLKNNFRSTRIIGTNCTSTISSLKSPEKQIGKKDHIRSYLILLLNELENVEQNPLFHPEGDALYHSLQVYQCALLETSDPELLAAALLHDVGKAIDYPNHDCVGAETIDGLLSPRIAWLIRHHLDLLVAPQKTRRLLAGKNKLTDLEKLRRWDIAGRKKDVIVMSPQQAIDELFGEFQLITKQSPSPFYS